MEWRNNEWGNSLLGKWWFSAELPRAPSQGNTQGEMSVALVTAASCWLSPLGHIWHIWHICTAAAGLGVSKHRGGGAVMSKV